MDVRRKRKPAARKESADTQEYDMDVRGHGREQGGVEFHSQVR